MPVTSEHFKIPIWGWVLVVVIILGIALGLGLGLGLKSSSDPTPSATAGVGGSLRIISSDLVERTSNMESGEIQNCPVATSAQISDWRINEQSVVCSKLPKFDTRSYRFKGTFFNEDQSKPNFVFEPRGIDDLMVSMDNVSGTFYSAYLTFNEDMWSEGFSGEGPKTEPKALVDTMMGQLDKTVLLMGEEAAPPESNCSPPFSFNVKIPTSNAMNIKGVERLKPVEGKYLKGALRMSMDHVDYDYKLNGTTQTVRVMLTSCDGVMGDKLIKIDGVFKWYDLETKTFVTTRNDNVLTFWNNNEGREGPQEDQKHEQGHYGDEGQHQGPTEEEQKAFHLAIVNAFSKRRIGMPVEIGDSSIDFQGLNKEDVEVTLNLLIDGYIGFRGAVAEEFTEASLLADPVAQIKKFDIPDLSLKALLTIV